MNVRGILQNIRDESTAFTIRLNWLAVVAFVYFWTYGLFGFFTIPKYGFTANFILTVVLAICLALFLYFSHRNNKHFSDSQMFTYRDIAVLVGYFLVIAVASFRNLFAPISSDNFYHAQQAELYSIKLTEILSRFTHMFDAVPFSFMLWSISFLLFVAGFLYVTMARRFGFWFFITATTTLFVFLRMSVYVLGGNASPFPTLRLFPLWVTSTAFSPSDFSFRIAAVLLLVALMFLVYKTLKAKCSPSVAFLAGLAVGTIPVVWHVGTIVEFSIWTTFIFTYVALFLFEEPKSASHYMRPIMLVGIATLMRVSGFIALIPLAIHFLLTQKRTWKELLEYTLLSIPVVLLILPVIVGNIVTGTPASYGGGAYPSVGLAEHVSLFGRLHFALSQGFVWTAVYNSFHGVLPFICIATIILGLRKWKALFSLAILFVISFTLFFSISPDLWGNGRYQAEYIAPCIILGIVLLVATCKKTFLAYGFLIALIAYNAFLFSSLPAYNRSLIGYRSYFVQAKVRDNYFVVSETPFPYNVALRDALTHVPGESVYYVPGDGYAYFAKILSGYTVGDMRQEATYRQILGVTVTDSTIPAILSNLDIKLVLINRAEKEKQLSQEKLANILLESGWKEQETFTDAQYGHMISGYIRP